jgi:hypothetical protein
MHFIQYPPFQNPRKNLLFKSLPFQNPLSWLCKQKRTHTNFVDKNNFGSTNESLEKFTAFQGHTALPVLSPRYVLSSTSYDKPQWAKFPKSRIKKPNQQYR